MSFNIIYVENDHRDYSEVEEAVKKYNDSSPSELLNVLQAENPDDLKEKLGFQFDVVLADIFFEDTQTGSPEGADRLDDIIKYVENWGKEKNGGRGLPIIAYSGRAALESCLTKKNILYDIWDKNTTTPEYVVWRLSKLAVEISRIQPDSYLQRLIRGMPTGASWHTRVIEMALGYNSGRTEYDQIEKAGTSIQDIAHDLQVWYACEPIWNVMTKWEALGRAVSHKTRGHARHVINVFWLGYYLLHHESMRDWFVERWQYLIDNRPKMRDVKNDDPVEALSNIWFYAGLFHDIAKCIETSREVNTCHSEILETFGDLRPIVPQLDYSPIEKLHHYTLEELLIEIENPLKDIIRPLLVKGLKEEKPDHGFLAGLHLRNSIKDGKQACYVREATRSIALHNIIGEIDRRSDNLLSWEDEPITCLLLLCDQIQTWDRERGDQQLSDKDAPQRAELLKLIIPSEKDKKLEMHIDYVAPIHILRVPEVYIRVKEHLKHILRDKPNRTLGRIKKPWPFMLKVAFSLSRDKILDMDMG